MAKNSENDNGSERKKRLPDRTEEYRRKWNENMRLNDFNEGDDIDEIIAKARSFKPKHFKSNQTIFLDKLANYLESI